MTFGHFHSNGTPKRYICFFRHIHSKLLASVECACRARHAQLQKTHLRHTQKKKKKKKKKKKRSEFGHAMFGNKLPSCGQLTMQISYACIYVHVQACRLCDDSSQYGLRSHMLLPKYRSGNPLSSNFHDFLKQSHEKLFHLQQLHAISVLVSFTVFVKFVRNAVGVP